MRPRNGAASRASRRERTRLKLTRTIRRTTRVAVALGTLVGLTSTLVACNGADATAPTGTGNTATGGSSSQRGPSPLFYSCSSTADCVANSLCVDQGYCKPLCSSDASCTSYPFANMSCRAVPGAASVCDDQEPHLYGNGGSQSSGGCASGSTYCSSCNVCIPQGCSYWCVAGAQGLCSASPSGLSGCTGPVHGGCDCGGGANGGNSGGSSSCAGSCGGSEVCVTFDSGATCEPICGDSSQCASGCCGTLQGTSTRACLPASYCSGGGGNGGSCPNVMGSVSAGNSNDNACPQDVTVHNGWPTAITCAYTLGDGTKHCQAIAQGTVTCAFYTGGQSWTITACAGGGVECANAIGCSF